MRWATTARRRDPAAYAKVIVYWLRPWRDAGNEDHVFDGSPLFAAAMELKGSALDDPTTHADLHQVALIRSDQATATHVADVSYEQSAAGPRRVYRWTPGSLEYVGTAWSKDFAVEIVTAGVDSDEVMRSLVDVSADELDQYVTTHEREDPDEWDSDWWTSGT